MIKALITIVSVLLIATSVSAEVALPLNDYAFRLEYDLLYQQAVRCGEVQSWPAQGPFLSCDFERLLSDSLSSPILDLLYPVSGDHVRGFAITQEKLQTGQSRKSEDLTKLTGGFIYRPVRSLGALVSFNLDRAKALDPDYTGKKWRGLAGEVETAALFFDVGAFDFSFGRQHLFWGPRETNLVLSAEAEPLDMLGAHFSKGRLDIAFVFARLDQSRPDSIDYIRFPVDSFDDNRYLAMHRLSVRLHRTLRVSLFETVIFGGAGRSPELYYLNPLQFFHTAQINENIDDNTMLGGDFTWFFRKGWSFYGQLLIDDIQVDDKEQADEEPAEVGGMAGLYRAGRTASFEPDLFVEYTHITNRTYHQRKPRNRYLYRNKLLGHPLGPDADSLHVGARFWPTASFSCEIGLAYCRHGEGTIYSPWDESFLLVDGDYDEPFPTGVVQKQFGAVLKVSGFIPVAGYVGRHFMLDFAAGYSDLSNAQHVLNCDVDDSFLDIAVAWFGSFDLFVGD
ncbi:MAG TPA: capsule assembly Wzi family protein [candidate division Zixibacteria bacterium]|nr:capsule assembly Wzi family protein [candidate division Zixibacteria bacterium]